jgi:hypothetical protein
MWIWRPEQETLLWTQLGTLIGATAALLDYSDPRTLLIIKYASLAALTVQEVSSTALLRLSQTRFVFTATRIMPFSLRIFQMHAVSKVYAGTMHFQYSSA